MEVLTTSASFRSSSFRIDSVNTFDVKVWRTREERALIRVTVELEAATCYV